MFLFGLVLSWRIFCRVDFLHLFILISFSWFLYFKKGENKVGWVERWQGSVESGEGKYTNLHLFTLRYHVYLEVRWVFWKQQKDGFCFVISSVNLYILMGKLNPLNIWSFFERCLLIALIFCCCCCYCLLCSWSYTHLGNRSTIRSSNMSLLQ